MSTSDLMDIIDDCKEKLTDGEYKSMTDILLKLYKNNEEKSEYSRYQDDEADLQMAYDREAYDMNDPPENESEEDDPEEYDPPEDDSILYLGPDATEEEKIRAVRQDGYFISHIENPSLELQLLAVRLDPATVRLIKEPSFEDKLAMINENPKAILFMDNPSLELQLTAVKKESLIIGYLPDPSEEIRLEAVRDYGDNIKFIKNPSLQVQLEAIRQASHSIRYIFRPYDEVQLEAVKRNPHVIKHIKNPRTEAVLEALRSDGSLITWCISLGIHTDEMMLAAMTNSSTSRYVARSHSNIMSENVMIFVVERDWELIRCIDNPPVRVRNIARDIREDEDFRYISEMFEENL